MKLLMYFLLVVVAIAVIIFIAFFIKTYLQVRDAKNGKPVLFNNFKDLTKFIRIYFTCEKQSHIALYGFVVDSIYEDHLVRMGISDSPHLSVEVSLITREGFESLTAICMDTSAVLNKGDFVAVLPIFNESKNIWTYTLVTKLKPLFLGGDKGFLIEEKYIDLN